MINIFCLHNLRIAFVLLFVCSFFGVEKAIGSDCDYLIKVEEMEGLRLGKKGFYIHISSKLENGYKEEEQIDFWITEYSVTPPQFEAEAGGLYSSFFQTISPQENFCEINIPIASARFHEGPSDEFTKFKNIIDSLSVKNDGTLTIHGNKVKTSDLASLRIETFHGVVLDSVWGLSIDTNTRHITTKGETIIEGKKEIKGPKKLHLASLINNEGELTLRNVNYTCDRYVGSEGSRLWVEQGMTLSCLLDMDNKGTIGSRSSSVTVTQRGRVHNLGKFSDIAGDLTFVSPDSSLDTLGQVSNIGGNLTFNFKGDHSILNKCSAAGSGAKSVVVNGKPYNHILKKQKIKVDDKESGKNAETQKKKKASLPHKTDANKSPEDGTEARKLLCKKALEAFGLGKIAISKIKAAYASKDWNEIKNIVENCDLDEEEPVETIIEMLAAIMDQTKEEVKNSISDYRATLKQIAAVTFQEILKRQNT